MGQLAQQAPELWQQRIARLRARGSRPAEHSSDQQRRRHDDDFPVAHSEMVAHALLSG
jgi:hypothetical protein